VGIVLLSLIVSTQSFFAAQFFYNHEQKSANYGMIWVVPAVKYSFWALLAPAIYRVSKKVSFDRNQALFGIFFVLFAGFLLATIHGVSTTSLFTTYEPVIANSCIIKVINLCHTHRQFLLHGVSLLVPVQLGGEIER